MLLPLPKNPTPCGSSELLGQASWPPAHPTYCLLLCQGCSDVLSWQKTVLAFARLPQANLGYLGTRGSELVWPATHKDAKAELVHSPHSFVSGNFMHFSHMHSFISLSKVTLIRWLWRR